MFVPKVIMYQSGVNPVYRGKNTASLTEIADLRVFHHHIYEFKKGIRNIILTTEKSRYKESIANKLKKENIDYLIHDVDSNKINVYFGTKECVDVVRTFSPRLNELTPERDFMLGIMLGYDRVKQCERYMKIKNNVIKLGKKPL